MKNIHFILLCVAVFCISCGDRSGDKNVVARVGDQSITFTELETSFMLDPQYLTRTPLSSARHNQLDYLVQNKYYYFAAENMNLENDPLMRQRINYIKNHEILKSFINQTYLDTIKVQAQEMRRGLDRWSKRLHVENYFIKDDKGAQYLIQQYDQGQLNAVFLIDQKGEDLGWITFGDLDPMLEDAVYQLADNEVSQVVKSQYGYHLLRVSGRQPNEDFERLNDRLRLQKVTEVIRRRKADTAIRADLKKLAGGRQIQVNNRLLEVIVRKIQATTAAGTADITQIVPPVTNRELINLELDIKDIYDQTLVKFNNEITVGTFIERLKQMPPFHRPYIKGRTFLLQAIIDMVRNDLLLQKAVTEGFADKKTVRENYQTQINDFLSREFGLRINSSIFRENHPLDWQTYQQAYLEAKEKNDLVVYQDNLFPDAADPDSIMTQAPVPVFLKNRYVW
jgi:peptidyl-prolyl cis-trans isomerase C